MKTRLYNILIIAITIIGAGMRFYNLNQMSLMNDELSALMRTHFNNFHDLIYKGVATEGHPAGVQLFLFAWTKLFGDAVWVLRLPFAAAGTLCIPLIYLVGSKWFNKTAGLLAALSFSMLQFTILYSQLARMYAMGMFFVLLFAYALTQLFFEDKIKLKNRWRIAFIISAAGCLYTHYFAALVMAIIMICSFFILFFQKKNDKEFIVLSLISLATFLPHVPLFFTQFGLGGVGGPGGWLPPPNENTWREFLNVLFNQSDWLYYLFLGIMIISFVVRRKKIDFNFYHLTSALIIIIPFAIGYYYSVTRNPVLQVTGILFGFPFLLMFAFSFLPQKPAAAVLTLTLLLAGIMFYSTVFEKKYYSTYHFGQFKKPAELTMKFDEKFGAKNITHACNAPNADYFKYYFDNANKPFLFEVKLVNDDSTLNQLKQLVNQSTKNYFLFTWSNMFTPAQTEEIIRSKFPFTIYKEDFFNSGFVLLSKNPDPNSSMKLLESYTNDFEKGLSGNYSEKIDSLYYASGNYSADIAGKEFALNYQLPAAILFNQKQVVITASIKAMVAGDSCSAVLVISVDGDGHNLLWKGTELKGLMQRDRFEKITNVAVLPQNLKGYETIRVYIWNRKSEPIYADDYSVKVEVLK